MHLRYSISRDLLGIFSQDPRQNEMAFYHHSITVPSIDQSRHPMILSVLLEREVGYPATGTLSQVSE